MSQIYRRRYRSKASEIASPIVKQSRCEPASRTSMRFMDQNKYQRFMQGSRWKNLILPEFAQDHSQNEDCQSVGSRDTFSRVSRIEQSRTRTFTEIEGLNFNHTADPKILKSSNLINSFNDNKYQRKKYPQVSAFSLKKNRTKTQFWSNIQSQQDKFDKQSLSSISKPYSINNQISQTSVGVQTDPQAKPVLTQQQVESLQEEVDYLRKYVFTSFEDCFKKNKSINETPKKQFTS